MPENSNSRLIIDEDFLDLQTLHRDDLRADILELFSKQLDKYKGQLTAEQTNQAFGTCLHTIKGAARGVGAVHLADVAKAIELEFERGNHNTPAGQIELLKAIKLTAAAIEKIAK